MACTGTYDSLKRVVLEMILASITNEATPFDFARLVRLAQVFVIADNGRTVGLTSVVVRTILDKVLTEELPPMATSQGFDVLTDLASWSKQHGCVDIDMPMVHSAYETVLRWVSTSRHLAEDSNVCRTVLQTFEQAIRTVTQQMHRAERPASSSAATPAHQDHSSSWRMRRDIRRLARNRAMSMAGPGAGQHATTTATASNIATSIISNYPSLAATMDLSSDVSFIQWELKIHLNRYMDLVRRSRDVSESSADHVDDLGPLRRLLERKGPAGGHGGKLSFTDHGIRFIMVDHRIVVGFIDTGKEEEDHLTLVFRDLMGKHVSQATMRMATSEFLEQHRSAEMPPPVDDADRAQRRPRPAPPAPPTPSRMARVEAVNEQYIPAFDQMFNEGTESARAAELVDQLMRDQSELERRHPLPSSTRVTEKSTIAAPTPKSMSGHPTQLFRQYCAQMGYLRKESRGDVAVLPLSHKLLDTLNEFDQIPT
ncbi:hypothetical protein SYNPS1DRAFT_23031 [Syncephalis pseudoplumigaleata]|uniref:Uncharacterized protein n=1 Tax=Syncephalis pseudoplumigaleata TaxID=1712513 RepID=A0A4P9YZT0_9FUNG|nr:hypothetical protein SYNPS1DRAFT_23031 [Syncephalis pseudoplumigaleata]|eukprot:RKP24931.1 hypothetical protein SYNPS1DRAFT_23031 [Syncephalis pseudoplumigaleata]